MLAVGGVLTHDGAIAGLETDNGVWSVASVVSSDFGFRILLDFFFPLAVDGDSVGHGVGGAVVQKKMNGVLG